MKYKPGFSYKSGPFGRKESGIIRLVMAQNDTIFTRTLDQRGNFIHINNIHYFS